MVRGPYEGANGLSSFVSALIFTEAGSMSPSHVCVVPSQQTGFSSMGSLVSTAFHAAGYGGVKKIVGAFTGSVWLGGTKGGILVHGTHVHNSPVAYSPTAQ